MKKGLCPDFPVMVNDWLSSTCISMMTPAEEGGYWHLLCHAWNDPDCRLPDDDDALAKLSRLGDDWAKGSGKKIRASFVEDPSCKGSLVNLRQMATRIEQQGRQAAAADKCATMRAAKEQKRLASLLKGDCEGSYKEAAEGSLEALSSPLSPLSSGTHTQHGVEFVPPTESEVAAHFSANKLSGASGFFGYHNSRSWRDIAGPYNGDWKAATFTWRDYARPSGAKPAGSLKPTPHQLELSIQKCKERIEWLKDRKEMVDGEYIVTKKAQEEILALRTQVADMERQQREFGKSTVPANN